MKRCLQCKKSITRKPKTGRCRPCAAPLNGFQKGHSSWLGKKRAPFDDRWLKKMSEAVKRRHEGSSFGFRHGNKLWKGNIGRKLSPEHVRILIEANSGPKSHLWRGGKSFEPYPLAFTRALKRSIRERDDRTCQICGDCGNEVHHIDYDKENCEPTNLITLCKSCHAKTNFRRECWETAFKNPCLK